MEHPRLRIGIGLPDRGGVSVLGLARSAEECGFSFVSVRDRHAFEGYDGLTLLAAAAGATKTIGLVTNVTLVPTRNTVLLAREVAALHELSGGRMTLGVGVGERDDDFTVTDTEFATRGPRFDAALATLHSVWRGDRVSESPRPMIPAGFEGTSVPLMIGGTIDLSIDRTVHWGIGWTMARWPSMYTDFIKRLQAAWRDADRTGEPRIAAIGLFAFGSSDEERMRWQFTHHVGDNGRTLELPQSAIRNEGMKPIILCLTPTAVQELVQGYRAAGVTDLHMLPVIPELSQIEELAAALAEMT